MEMREIFEAEAIHALTGLTGKKLTSTFVVSQRDTPVDPQDPSAGGDNAWPKEFVLDVEDGPTFTVLSGDGALRVFTSTQP